MLNKTKAQQIVDYIKEYPRASIQYVASELGTSTSYVLRVQKAVRKTVASSVVQPIIMTYQRIAESCKI